MNVNDFRNEVGFVIPQMPLTSFRKYNTYIVIAQTRIDDEGNAVSEEIEVPLYVMDTFIELMKAAKDG